MKRKVIAVTGGIGSGKSQVARVLRTLGYKTVDCDVIAKQIADDPELIGKVERLLGTECVTNGKLNRKVIREKVFADEILLGQYQALFFDGVKQRLIDILQMTAETVFVEIPILDAFELHWDEVWRVESDEATRIERVQARDNVSAESVSNTIARQKHYANCTRVIANNGSLDDLTDAVKKALAESKLIH